jgi:hypothetical protein
MEQVLAGLVATGKAVALYMLLGGFLVGIIWGGVAVVARAFRCSMGEALIGCLLVYLVCIFLVSIYLLFSEGHLLAVMFGLSIVALIPREWWRRLRLSIMALLSAWGRRH